MTKERYYNGNDAKILKEINFIVDSFKIYGVNLTKNQAYTAYYNWSEENYYSSWTDGLDTWSKWQVVRSLQYYIPKDKRELLRK